MGVIVTSHPEHSVPSAGTSKMNVAELFRDVPPIRSVSELAASDVFESDEELDDFLSAVRADRDADLA